jgi:hypothetical protein
MDEVVTRAVSPWNKGKLIGQKAPFKLKEIWAIRFRLQIYSRTRELALFDLGIDSKLRACDLVKLKVRDISHGERIAARAIVLQKKDLQTGAVRNHRTDAIRSGRLDQAVRLALGRLSLPKPHPWLAPSEHQAICPDRRLLGRGNRP